MRKGEVNAGRFNRKGRKGFARSAKLVILKRMLFHPFVPQSLFAELMQEINEERAG